MQPFDLVGIIVDGQGAQFDAQCIELILRLLQRFIGSLKNRVHDLPRTVQQFLVVVGQFSGSVQQLLRAVVQLFSRIYDLVRLFA